MPCGGGLKAAGLGRYAGANFSASSHESLVHEAGVDRIERACILAELLAKIEEPEIQRLQEYHQVHKQGDLATVGLHDPRFQMKSAYTWKRCDGTLERRQFTSLNIHLDQVRRRDRAFLDKAVDRSHRDRSWRRKVSFLPVDGR
jgi:hypothetical protein